jgi:hypothetical protein
MNWTVRVISTIYVAWRTDTSPPGNRSLHLDLAVNLMPERLGKRAGSLARFLRNGNLALQRRQMLFEIGLGVLRTVLFHFRNQSLHFTIAELRLSPASRLRLGPANHGVGLLPL